MELSAAVCTYCSASIMEENVFQVWFAKKDGIDDYAILGGDFHYAGHNRFALVDCNFKRPGSQMNLIQLELL